MRKKKYLEKKKGIKKGRVLGLFAVILLLILVILGLFYKYSSNLNFSFVRKTSGGGGEILIIDSINNKTSKISLDPDLELDSARGYGKYKLSSLWVLGEKERINGKLVSESINKNYFTPIYLWDDGKNSNLNIFQKFALLMKLRNVETVQLTSLEILSPLLFGLNETTDIKVEMDDLTGNSNTSVAVSKILSNLSLKVQNYSRGYDENLDCEVKTENEKLGQFISNLFECKFDRSGETFLIRIGGVFDKRF
jgi:hypothetical protein